MAEKSFKPPAGAVAAAKRALKKRAEASPSNRGGTAVGLARARDIAAGKSLPLGTVKRMASFFARHAVDKKGSTWDSYGKGRQAWDLWGGNAGAAWAKAISQNATKKGN